MMIIFKCQGGKRNGKNMEDFCGVDDILVFDMGNSYVYVF